MISNRILEFYTEMREEIMTGVKNREYGKYFTSI